MYLYVDEIGKPSRNISPERPFRSLRSARTSINEDFPHPVGPEKYEKIWIRIFYRVRLPIIAFIPDLNIPETSSRIFFGGSGWRECMQNCLRKSLTNVSPNVYFILRNDRVPADFTCLDIGGTGWSPSLCGWGSEITVEFDIVFLSNRYFNVYICLVQGEA